MTLRLLVEPQHMLLPEVPRENLYLPPAADGVLRRDDVLPILLAVPGGAVRHASAPEITQEMDKGCKRHVSTEHTPMQGTNSVTGSRLEPISKASS
jgi:hypothetical protein